MLPSPSLENRANPDRRETAALRLITSVVAAFVFGVTLAAAVHRSIEDVALIFVNAPHHIVPDGHNQQVRILKATVPAGSTIFYLVDVPEAWQLGLWQRSLYPDYVVRPVHGLAHLKSAGRRRLSEEKGVEYAISAGNPPINPSFQWQVALPSYPNGVPVLLGKLPPE